MKNIAAVLFFLFSVTSLWAQDNEQQLEEVVVSSSRIDLPLSENSRTIQLISAQEILESGVTNVVDLLQQVAGVDIRRRGAQGMQADLYIRGGSFDQTLLLIDGIKVDDPQTGHHTLNTLLPVELIERIEIVKGPAARIYGQNAFTGAINIVTKKQLDAKVVATAGTGSFGRKNLGVSLDLKGSILHFSENTSKGYRYNTDYKNENLFVKSHLNVGSTPITFLGTISDRAFGANGFYATPSAKDQYERTQASLVSFYTQFEKGNWIYKPSLFWKRNQDMYIYIRNNPEIYRNMHISNKVGGSLMASYYSKAGITGLGIESSKVFIVSNNLGAHQRMQWNGFVEHRFSWAKNKLDFTPGVALNYFSDFKFHAFPGADLGYRFSDNFKAYANIGYTYRIPTYTDLYYKDRTTKGNADLAPEEALSEELGFRYQFEKGTLSMAWFMRDTDNLIDYVKQNEADLWEAQNFAALKTTGIEVNASLPWKIFGQSQYLNIGYTYIDDSIKEVNVPFSRYAINSLKHQWVTDLNLHFNKNIPASITYTYAERTTGTNYGVLDSSLQYVGKNITWSFTGNNLMDAEYSETNLVPAPGVNFMLGMKYSIR